MYDPFNFYLKMSQEDLLCTIQSDLQSIVDDKLTIIAKDENNEICGCYAGFKLSRLSSLYEKSNHQIEDTIPIKNTNLISTEELYDKINYSLIKKSYDEHKSRGELDKAIFCDHFCISEKYFNTSLSKDLTFNFFQNNLEKGIEHVYGSFFNIKSLKIAQKYFKANIVKKIHVIFKEEEAEQDLNSSIFEVKLLHATTKNLKNLKNYKVSPVSENSKF